MHHEKSDPAFLLSQVPVSVSNAGECLLIMLSVPLKPVSGGQATQLRALPPVILTVWKKQEALTHRDTAHLWYYELPLLGSAECFVIF